MPDESAAAPVRAAAELPTLRAIASADLHNLVFQRDYRIIPAIVHGWASGPERLKAIARLGNGMLKVNEACDRCGPTVSAVTARPETASFISADTVRSSYGRRCPRKAGLPRRRSGRPMAPG